MKINLWIVAFVSVLIFISAVSGQTNNSLVCYEKKVYLLNKETVVPLGKCDKKDWLVPLQIEAGEVTKQIKQTKRERQILKLLKNINTDNLKEININETNLSKYLTNAKSEPTAKIFLNSLSESMQKLLTRNKETEMMEFIITSGSLVVDEYTERSRFTVKVEGPNPTIGDIEEAVKTELRKDVNRTKFDIYLMKHGEWKPLEVKRTITDYGIKNQDLLAMFSSVR